MKTRVMASTVFTEVFVKMFAQLSSNTPQAYQPFYDEHAAGQCFAPQSVTTPLTEAQISTLRNEVQKLASERCKDFVNQLLTRAGMKGGDTAVTTNLATLFNLVASQGGFAFARQSSGGRGYSSAGGAVGGAENAQVLISADLNVGSAAFRNRELGRAALAELTHVAGSKPSYYASGAFSDVALAGVAYQLSRDLGKNYLPPPTIDPSKDVYGAYSNYYHGILNGFCNGK